METYLENCDAILIGATCGSTQSNALTEANIPGASFGNREPEKFKITELRFWLQYRGAGGLSKLKTKADTSVDDKFISPLPCIVSRSQTLPQTLTEKVWLRETMPCDLGSGRSAAEP